MFKLYAVGTSLSSYPATLFSYAITRGGCEEINLDAYENIYCLTKALPCTKLFFHLEGRKRAELSSPHD